jgi:ABC-type transporter Mla MlaB component
MPGNNESDKTLINEMVFGDVLDITMALEYYGQLKQYLNDNKKIVLNAGKIERIDGAGLQLIVAFIMEAKKLNLQVSWSGKSENFKKNADILGVSEKLAL